MKLFNENFLFGLIQGITEIFPISSTMHYIFLRTLLKTSVEEGYFFEVFLHLGSLLALMIYFRDFVKEKFIELFRFFFRKNGFHKKYKNAVISEIRPSESIQTYPHFSRFFWSTFVSSALVVFYLGAFTIVMHSIEDSFEIVDKSMLYLDTYLAVFLIIIIVSILVFFFKAFSATKYFHFTKLFWSTLILSVLVIFYIVNFLIWIYLKNLENFDKSVFYFNIFSTIIFFFVFFFKKSNLKSMKDLSIKDSVVVGVIQSFAIIPGMSRMGINLIAMRLLGYKFKDSVQLSFMFSIPIIFASAVFTSIQFFLQVPNLSEVFNFIEIFFSSFIITLIFISIGIKLMSSDKSIYICCAYRILVSIIFLLIY